MPKGDTRQARCTEAEFIELRNKHSAKEVAQILSLSSPAKVYERQRRIERDYGIILGQKQDNNPDYLSAIREVSLTNGCVIVFNDAHYWPGEPPTMHRALVHLIKKLKPEVVVANGDIADFPALSRFPSIGWEKAPTVKDELEVVQDRMDEIFKASRNAQHYWTAGNHDLRFESKIANVLPELRGVHGIHLKDHVAGWTPCWAVDVNRDTQAWTEIRHREKGGIHAGYNNTVSSGITLVTGHDHRAEVVPYNDRRGRRYGVRPGMTADSPLGPQFRDYLESRRINWQSGLALLTYKAGELLMPELCLKVRDGVVEFRGDIFTV
jgi:hypothetical protein